MDNIIIKKASIGDAKRLLEIYAPYVKTTPITFEYEVPSVEEFALRIKTTLQKYPYLIAKIGDMIVGYAYTSSFHSRAAYQWAAEISIYIDIDYKGRGIGKQLYQELERISLKQNIYNLNACITYGNPGSIAFHESFDYHQVAHFTKCGYKFGKWHDMIWMEKILAPHPSVPKPFVSYTEIGE